MKNKFSEISNTLKFLSSDNNNIENEQQLKIENDMKEMKKELMQIFEFL